MKKNLFSDTNQLRSFLEEKVAQFNQASFIQTDPISIPHLFSKREDIEIMGFWTATLAWGQRPTILAKAKELIRMMDGVPHQFVTQHQPHHLKALEGFVHRTFNGTDTLYFIHFLRHVYHAYGSLEAAFFGGLQGRALTVENGLNQFSARFASLEFYPQRTGKHVSSPLRKSACKRLNMFLRWMVRTDTQGVDFGIWKAITPAQLVCPLDLHVDRNARLLGLLTRPATDWQAALELTARLQELDPADPVKYDFALFGLGIEKYFGKPMG